MGESTPKRGDVALCSAGRVGLIECDEPIEIEYPDGNKGAAWIGMHLTPRYGARWSSRNPRVIARKRENGTYEPVANV